VWAAILAVWGWRHSAAWMRVLALLILIASPVVIARTSTDIFPSINIPVIAVAWNYRGLNTEELEGRITSNFERTLTTTVDNIQRIESTTTSGQSIIKVYLQPGARLDTANAQITAISQTVIRSYPPGTTPPLILNFSASSVPILQLALSGEGLAEQELFDLGVNFLRPQLVTIPGVAIPWPYGGKQRQIMVDLNPRLLQAKGLSPSAVLDTLNVQNLILPSGTAKIGRLEYDVTLNAAPRTVPELAYGLNATILFGTDTFLAGYARVADNYDFYACRYVFAGAERVKPETRKTWFDKFGIRILEGYGATETAPAIAVNTPMHFRAGTVGRLLPGLEHRLDAVPGIADGARLVVRGPNVMLGYLRAESPGVLQPPDGGWYDTGDIVAIDGDGFVTIKGRAKRFAKVAGEMVPLGAVEDFITTLWPASSHAVRPMELR